MNKLFLTVFLFSHLFSGQSYYEYGQKVELTPLKPNRSVSLTSMTGDKNSSIRYFEKPNAQIVGVDNSIIAKCLDEEECQRVMKTYAGLTFERLSKDIYLIYLEKPEEIFDNSLKLYEEGCFEYVHPNFYKEKQLR